jgi:hypothetical protein
VYPDFRENFCENENFREIFRENENFREIENFHEISRKVSEFLLIFAFRENEKRGFRFNPMSYAQVFDSRVEDSTLTRFAIL